MTKCRAVGDTDQRLIDKLSEASKPGTSARCWNTDPVAHYFARW
jgi:hypothetical protein